MFRIRKPTDGLVQQFIEPQRQAPLNYTEVGHTRDSDIPPVGFHPNRWQSIIGNGDRNYRRAMVGIRDLYMLNLGWIQVVSGPTRLEAEQLITTLVRRCRIYALQATRVVYVIDEQPSLRRFGFGYGTLLGHLLCGEERFTVAINEQTGDVSYEIYSFSKPATRLGKLGVGYLRHLQKQFCRESADALKRFIRQHQGGGAKYEGC